MTSLFGRYPPFSETPVYACSFLCVPCFRGGARVCWKLWDLEMWKQPSEQTLQNAGTTNKTNNELPWALVKNLDAKTKTVLLMKMASAASPFFDFLGKWSLSVFTSFGQNPKYGGFLTWGYPNSRMVYNRKSYWNGWLGYPYFRKPPYLPTTILISITLTTQFCLKIGYSNIQVTHPCSYHATNWGPSLISAYRDWRYLYIY